ncbi:MAG: SIMPL domain-containing protein [Pseudomonadota bacterium]
MSRLVSTTLLVAALALPLSATANHHPAAPGLIHATASATTETVPDRATVSAGVQTDGKTAQDAMRRNAELMQNVFRALSQAGVPEQDVSTSYLNLNPRYNYENRVNGQPQLVGYQASNQISITTRDLDSVGRLIDSLLSAGVNNINNVQFSVADTDSAQELARTEAIMKARRKALSMASAAGVNLGRLVSLSEGSAPTPSPYYPMTANVARSDSLEMAPPLAPGQREVRATVTLSYAIAD